MFHSGLCTFRRFTKGGNCSRLFTRYFSFSPVFAQTFFMKRFLFFFPRQKTNWVKVCEGFNGILIRLPCLWSRSSCRGSESARVGPDPQLDLTQPDYVGGTKDKIKTCCLRRDVCRSCEMFPSLNAVTVRRSQRCRRAEGEGGVHPRRLPPPRPAPPPRRLPPCEGLVSLQI